MTDDLTPEKARASAWFEDLRNQICAAFEGLEDVQNTGPHAGLPAGRFERKPTKRDNGDGTDAGGGEMSVMRGGRVFEKVGVNISTVYGTLGEAAQRSMKSRTGMGGITEDPRFWASGISLVAHMRSPKTPAVHMNTRMFWTPHAGGLVVVPTLTRWSKFRKIPNSSTRALKKPVTCTTQLITRDTKSGLTSIS